MAKENDGKAARRRAMKQMLCISACVLVFTVLFVSMNNHGSGAARRGNNKSHQHDDKPFSMSHNGNHNQGGGGRHGLPRRYVGRRHENHRGHPGDDDKGRNDKEENDNRNVDPQETAARYRRDLTKQFESKEEHRLLEDVLNAKLHLMDVYSVQEEVERAPSNSYNGVYGSFCRLNFKLHKENPASGTYLVWKCSSEEGQCDICICIDLYSIFLTILYFLINPPCPLPRLPKQFLCFAILLHIRIVTIPLR
jgi:hypothetical protein